jgi:hypothetical protein
MKRAKWVMCCWQLITTTECPPAIRLLVVLIMVTFQFSGCGTVWRWKKFRVVRSYRPQLFREAFAAQCEDPSCR